MANGSAISGGATLRHVRQLQVEKPAIQTTRTIVIIIVVVISRDSPQDKRANYAFFSGHSAAVILPVAAALGFSIRDGVAEIARASAQSSAAQSRAAQFVVVISIFFIVVLAEAEKVLSSDLRAVRDIRAI